MARNSGAICFRFTARAEVKYRARSPSLPSPKQSKIIRMSVALVTGSAGLIGSETCLRLHAEGMEIVGVVRRQPSSSFQW